MHAHVTKVTISVPEKNNCHVYFHTISMHTHPTMMLTLNLDWIFHCNFFFSIAHNFDTSFKIDRPCLVTTIYENTYFQIIFTLLFKLHPFNAANICGLFLTLDP